MVSNFSGGSPIFQCGGVSNLCGGSPIFQGVSNFSGGDLQFFEGGSPLIFQGVSSNFSGGLQFFGGDSPEYGQRSAGTHPTGMHSCFLLLFTDMITRQAHLQCPLVETDSTTFLLTSLYVSLSKLDLP